jgi:hypothetical protein
MLFFFHFKIEMARREGTLLGIITHNSRHLQTSIPTSMGGNIRKGWHSFIHSLIKVKEPKAPNIGILALE